MLYGVKVMNTYLITGANGFVGNNLIREIEILDPEARVIAMVQPDTSSESLAGIKCEICEADVTDPATLNEPFELASTSKGDLYVIHCAGVIDISAKANPALWRVNVEGTENVANAIEHWNPHFQGKIKIIHVASVHAIPEAPSGVMMCEPKSYDPNLVVGQYAKSKAAGAQLILDRIRQRRLEGCIVLPSGIIGPFNFGPENMKSLIIKVAKGSLRACVHGGYDFVDVRDVAQGIVSSCRNGRNGESYILSNRSVEITEICNEVCSFSNKPPIHIVLPIELAKSAAPFFEVWYQMRDEVPLFTRYALHTLESNSLFSSKKLSINSDITFAHCRILYLTWWHG